MRTVQGLYHVTTFVMCDMTLVMCDVKCHIMMM